MRLNITKCFILLAALIASVCSSGCIVRPPDRETTTTASPSPSPTSVATPSPVATASPSVSPSSSPVIESPTVPPIRQPVPLPSPAPSPPAPLTKPASPIIPVAGVRREQLRDTFDEARSEGRVHEAIDIMAARGTPVLAAADGTVVKLFNSEKGGITIYQLSTDQKVVYYYAHLDSYADGLTEGKRVRQGEVIGAVGDTGNAGPGNYHLHFAIWLISDPKHYWTGVNLNPYPLLRGASTIDR